jgi:hypothetical protein
VLLDASGDNISLLSLELPRPKSLRPLRQAGQMRESWALVVATKGKSACHACQSPARTGPLTRMTRAFSERRPYYYSYSAFSRRVRPE